MWFKILLFFAELGFWKYEWYFGFQPISKLIPRGKVIYSDGQESTSMPLGNACSYANMFNGKVVKI